jgi:sugar-phosphatase
MRVIGVGPRAAAFAPDVHVPDLTHLAVTAYADGTIELRVTAAAA